MLHKKIDTYSAVAWLFAGVKTLPFPVLGDTHQASEVQTCQGARKLTAFPEYFVWVASFVG